jgi:hypothetical protein
MPAPSPVSGAAGAAVFEVDEEVEGRADYLVRARALDVGDEANATGIMFFTGSIEALRLRACGASARQALVTGVFLSVHGCVPNPNRY